MTTTIKDVIKLAEQQKNGAVLEVLHVEQDDWQNVYAPLGDCNLDNIRKVRLKAPAGVPDRYKWTGIYDVPTEENCDGWLCDTGVMDSSSPILYEITFNNGYRYLLRKEVPQVVPYAWDTFVLKSSHALYFDTSLIPIGRIEPTFIVIGNTRYTWDKVGDQFEWPDGSPFGVVQEVTAC